MPIKTGRYGKVSWDPAGGSALVQIVSINAWTGSFKNEYEDVTCFADANRVFIPGLMTAEGSFSGFWNSSELALFRAAMSPTPGTLQLMPNTTEPTFFWQGPAYMGADIDCSLEAPKVTGEWKAAGDWAVPGEVLATGAAPGTGTGELYAGRRDAAGRTSRRSPAVTANPATAWTTGQRILLADGTSAHWNGTAWVVGREAVDVSRRRDPTRPGSHGGLALSDRRGLSILDRAPDAAREVDAARRGDARRPVSLAASAVTVPSPARGRLFRLAGDRRRAHRRHAPGGHARAAPVLRGHTYGPVSVRRSRRNPPAAVGRRLYRRQENAERWRVPGSSSTTS